MRPRINIIALILLTTHTVYAAVKPVAIAAPSEALTRLSWLVGTWKSKMGGTEIFESWRQESTSRFRGMGYSLAGKDTSISEKLLIEASDSGLFYISDVAHNPAPVYFKMVRQDSVTTIFENPRHDFPTRIIYRQVTTDSLHARIEGRRKGKDAGVDYLFGRAK